MVLNFRYQIIDRLVNLHLHAFDNIHNAEETKDYNKQKNI
jgi:hypothetical protein